MLLPPPISDILNIAKKLKDGADIRKCKIDGKKVQLESGKMQAEDSLSAVKITCTYKEGANTVNIEAHHPVTGDNDDVIKIDSNEVEAADIDLRPIPHLVTVDVKATLEYKREGTAHTIELYSQIASVI